MIILPYRGWVALCIVKNLFSEVLQEHSEMVLTAAGIKEALCGFFFSHA
jgi:hypothetical protein